METIKKILIAGASGLVGSRLTEMLKQEGFDVCHLSRNKNNKSGIKTFVWDIEKQTLESGALADVYGVINLAGTGLAEKRWTDERKKNILESRTQSTALLFKQLQNSPVKVYISASAVGYYGPGNAATIFSESNQPGNDFLSHVTSQWEIEAGKIATLGIRVVVMRTGIVLSNKGGALEPMAKAANSLLGAPLGTGKQYMSWIHIDDLCRMYIQAINDERMKGAYNAVGPEPVTNTILTKEIAEALHKPVILPKVPAFVLKIMFGEMSAVVLDGARVSCKKILETGFKFKFTSANDAVNNLLR